MTAEKRLEYLKVYNNALRLEMPGVLEAKISQTAYLMASMHDSFIENNIRNFDADLEECKLFLEGLNRLKSITP